MPASNLSARTAIVWIKRLRARGACQAAHVEARLAKRIRRRGWRSLAEHFEDAYGQGMLRAELRFEHGVGLGEELSSVWAAGA